MTTDNDDLLADGSRHAINHGMGVWKHVGENLVRHWGGTVYLRAKVSGKIIRQSMETSSAGRQGTSPPPQHGGKHTGSSNKKMKGSP